MLKEYEFSPNQEIVAMKTDVARVYTGKKVRFSVKGVTMGIDDRPLA